MQRIGDLILVVCKKLAGCPAIGGKAEALCVAGLIEGLDGWLGRFSGRWKATGHLATPPHRGRVHKIQILIMDLLQEFLYFSRVRFSKQTWSG